MMQRFFTERRRRKILGLLPRITQQENDVLLHSLIKKFNLEQGVLENDLYVLEGKGLVQLFKSDSGITGPIFITNEGVIYVEEQPWKWYKSSWFKFSMQHGFSLMAGFILAYFTFWLGKN